MLRKSIQFSRNLISYQYKREVAKGIMYKWFPVFLKYPVNQIPRYGYFKPKILGIDNLFKLHEHSFRDLIETFKPYKDKLFAITLKRLGDQQPFWDNPWFTSLDAAVLYAMVAKYRPEQYIEIGSGNSTKFARRSVVDNGLRTTITSIDPHPRAEIDVLSDHVMRKALEDHDLEVFKSVKKGDFVFFDGSHRCFMNSDVTVFFMEIMPMLPAGTIIHIHDIHLPYDYPPERIKSWESEQYLLGAQLLTNQSTYTILCPNNYICNQPELCEFVNQTLPISKLLNKKLAGSSLWMIKN